MFVHDAIMGASNDQLGSSLVHEDKGIIQGPPGLDFHLRNQNYISQSGPNLHQMKM
jgi:hypothetical protein